MKSSGQNKGFTLIEVMIGLILFTIGIMGFTGMVMMMSKGQHTSRTRDEAATLVQSQIEDLSGISFNSLGSDTGLPGYNGLSGADIRNEGPINRNGDEVGSGDGPYNYMRYLVVCTSSDTSVSSGDPQEYCGVLDDSNRPAELACNTLTLTDREKMLRVMVSYTDRSNTCRKALIDSLAFDWDGTGS